MILENFLEFSESFSSNQIRIINKKLNCMLREYSFLYVTNKIDYNNYPEIFQNMKESNAVIVNLYGKNGEYFLIGFKKTIIIIKQTSISFLEELFSYNSDLKICFLSNINDIFQRNIKTTYKELKINYQIEILSFNQNLEFPINVKKSIKNIWKEIRPCITYYLIYQSYCKSNYDRFEQFFLQQNEASTIETLNESDYIELCRIGVGSVFFVNLIYHIEKEKFLVIKKPISVSNEIPKLIKREIDFYSKLKHPLLPRIYGIVNSKSYIVIEYINGKTLDNIKMFHLSNDEKLTIIFELMLILEFIHHNKYIFRDLKPNNIMLDSNKNVVLIDFDRAIYFDDMINNNDFTNDFASNYVAPEVNDGVFSYECDIYSLGLVIYYIIKEEEYCSNNPTESNIFGDYLVLNEIFYSCIDKISLKRSCISELILRFLNSYKTQIKINNIDKIVDTKVLYCKQQESYVNKICIISENANKNDPNAQYLLGLCFIKGKYMKIDIDKGIECLTQSANQGNPYSQQYLGYIYMSGKYKQKDINKGIQFLNLAANQGISDASKYLGDIFFIGEIVEQDINKAIYYYKLAANQNDSKAQFLLGEIFSSEENKSYYINKAIYYYTLAANNGVSEAQNALGFIYYENISIARDINKAIHYFTLAADQNFIKSQYSLGFIYYHGEFIKRDIIKGIHYFTLAADQGYVEAQYNLGVIYYSGEFIKCDINKSIYYYTLAANQGFKLAQYNLGNIYLKNEFVKQDLKKSIHFYTLASNQNIPEAQFDLGFIYYNNQYDVFDINKAIHYLTLAANNNISQAQYILGEIFLDNKYIKRDINKSIYYLELAAKQDIPHANFKLGNIYLNENYITHDIKKGIDYIKKAANLNDDKAQFF